MVDNEGGVGHPCALPSATSSATEPNQPFHRHPSERLSPLDRRLALADADRDLFSNDLFTRFREVNIDEVQWPLPIARCLHPSRNRARQLGQLMPGSDAEYPLLAKYDIWKNTS